MGLSDQQHLYVLPNYFLLYNSDHQIVGLLTQSQVNGNTLSKLEKEGYYTELVNFDALNMRATKLLEELGITKHKWMSADVFLERLKKYEEDK